MNKKSLKLFAAVIAAVSVFTVFGRAGVEAAGTLKVSDQLVGEGVLIESTKGLTKLSDAEKKSFVAAVDKKYAKEIIEDYNGDATIELSANMPVKQFAGANMNVNVAAEAEFADSEASKMSMAECDIKSSVLFMSSSTKIHSYTDKENGVEYRKTVGSAGDVKWVKTEKKSVINTETEMPFLSGDKIREVYRSSESGCYAAVLEIDEDSLNKITGSGLEEMEELGFDDIDLEKGIYIATLDKGVSVIGIYADITDSLGGKKVTVSRGVIKAMVRNINSGLTIELPEEAKKAETKKK